MQLLPLGRQTTSASDRMSFRPTRFAVCQYELPGNLLLIFSVECGQGSVHLASAMDASNL